MQVTKIETVAEEYVACVGVLPKDWPGFDTFLGGAGVAIRAFYSIVGLRKHSVSSWEGFNEVCKGSKRVLVGL